MDVLAVKTAGDQAVAHCRAGKGPFLLEMKTYRYRGHSMSDPAKYRTREEVQRMRAEHDCLDSAKKHLEDMGYSEAELKKIDDDIKARVQEAADFAQSSPEPEEQELWTDILVEGV
jgi:pyruvate dehydrogenase E1 component alpha subunit